VGANDARITRIWRRLVTGWAAILAHSTVKEDDMALACELVTSTDHDAAVHRYDYLTKEART
jgi:hypothetical protein